MEKSDKLYNFDKRKVHRHGGKRRLGCGVLQTFVITLYEMFKPVKIQAICYCSMCMGSRPWSTGVLNLEV